MRRVQVVSGVLVVLAVAAGVLTFVRPGTASSVEVRLATATTRGITSRVMAQGKVRARTQVDVSSEVAGRVARVDVEVGDVVAVGAPLFALDGEQLRNAVEQLSAAIAGADAVLARADIAVKEAERAVERDRGLAAKGVLPDDTLKLSESRLASLVADRAQAEANVQRTRLDLNRARDALGRAKVVAPQAGTVVAVGVEVGKVVSSSTGLSASPDASLGLGIGGASAPVVIADLSELVVKLDVDELDISRVVPGQKAIVKAQGIKDVEFEGVVERVGLLGKDAMGAVQFSVDVKITGSRPAGSSSSSTASPTSSTGALEAAAGAAVAAPNQLLRPGMSAQAEIEVQHLDDVVVVPLAAVLEATSGDDGDKPDRVVVVEPGATDKSFVVRERTVRLGASEGEAVAVLSGLKANERIVEGPYRALKALKDGDTVSELVDDKKDGDKKDGDKKDVQKDGAAAKKDNEKKAAP
jgi:multidrug efflux pump subunit AcrA (membrane-fusion protein)